MGKTKSLLKTGATAIGVLHCINKIIDSVSISNTISKTTGKYYHWKHGDIFYRVKGSGNPIILIHDLNVFSSNYEWLQLADDLSKKYTVYTLDLIGCGKSDKPSLTYTNYFYVQMISDFINDVVHSPADIVVSGLSASFIIMADYMNKKLFQRIFMINPKSINFLKNVPDNRSRILLRLFDLPVIGKTAYYLATNKIKTEDYLTEDCYHNPFNVKPSAVKAYYDAAHTGNGEGKSLFASIQGNYLNVDISNAISNTENELIIINGEYRDNKDFIESSYKKLNSSISCFTVPDSKLLPQLENPDYLVKLIY